MPIPSDIIENIKVSLATTKKLIIIIKSKFILIYLLFSPDN